MAARISDPGRSAKFRALVAGLALASLIALLGVIFWPGVPMYDTVAQFGQVLGGDIDDWHPPIMVRLWQLLLPLAPGTGPMFVLEVALYALGFALVVASLVRSGRNIAALLAAALALSPLLLGWQMVVLKDAQMLGALLAAFGIVAHYRLGSRKVPAIGAVLAALLIVYATLVRANAVFATVPLGVLLMPRPFSLVGKAATALVLILVVLGLTPLINQRVFAAAPSGVATSQPLFDLAGIAAGTPGSVAPFTPAEREQIIRRHCVKAFFWDPITDPGMCGPVTQRANSLPATRLYADLAQAAAEHPLLYAERRLKHWNSTERWLVPPGRIDASPPDEAEPNDEGLRTPSSALVPIWQAVAGLEAATPLGWPILWTALAFLFLPIAWKQRSERSGGLAFALLMSVAVLEASFLVISIASDLRYHLWSMTAAPLGLILLGNELRLAKGALIAAAAAVLLVVFGGVYMRMSQPLAPSSYQAMLHAPTG